MKTQTIETIQINQHQTINESTIVENLVQLRARKAELDKQVKNLESILKDINQTTGQTTFNSYEHTLTITLVNQSRTDYKAIASHYGYSDYMFNKHTKQTSYQRLSLKTKNKTVV